MGKRVRNCIRNSRRVMRMVETAGDCTRNPKRVMRMGSTGGHKLKKSKQNG